MSAPRLASGFLGSFTKWFTLLLFSVSSFWFLSVVEATIARHWGWTLFSVLLVSLMDFHDREHLKLTGVITVILGVCYWMRYGFFGASPMWEVFGYFSLSGVASVLAIIIRSECGFDAWKRLIRLYPAFALILIFWVGTELRNLCPSSNFFLRDHTLLRIDREIGIAFSSAVGNKFRIWPWLAMPCQIVYASVAFWIVFGGFAGKKPRAAYWLSVLIATATGFTSYLLVPAVGPRYIWGADFDIHMVGFFEYSTSLVSAHKAINCMPSLHATWTMLVFWNSWKSTNLLVRVLGAAVLGATVLATLGLGEHYSIDIVVAVPFAYAIHSATNPEFSWSTPQRRYPVLAGGVLFLVWELLLATGGFTVVSTLVLQLLTLLSMAMPAAPVLWRTDLREWFSALEIIPSGGGAND